MTEQSKKIVLPAYLIRRCEAFRIVKGDAQSYIVRDKLHGKTFDFDPWQFFILEVLPGCETFEKLQSVFRDRFDREITRHEFDELLAGLADSRLLDPSALQHPLLSVFAKRSYDVVDGKAVPRTHSAAVGLSGVVEKAPEPEPATAPKVEDANADLPPGVQDAVGLDERASKRMLDLFDPRPLLGLLAPVVAPLRYAIYALPVMLLVALMVVASNSHLLIEDLHGLRAQLSLFVRIVFVLFTVNALATITSSFVAHSYKVAVERIGITLMVGFIPRFVTRMRGVERLSRRERMWLHGSNIVLRLLLLCAGVLLWYNTRDSQGALQELSLMLTLTVGASILLDAGNPLAKGSAYFLLSAYLNEPHLRGKAYKALMNKLKAGVYQSSDSTVLALYALATMSYLIFIIAFLTLGLTEWLLGHLDLGGTALLLAAAFAGYLLWRNYVGLKKFGDTYERTSQFDRWRRRTLIAEGQTEGELVTQRPSYWKRALLVCLPLLLLVPYSYQPSGTFTIFPASKQVISTDTPGLIEAVYFDGGESVKQGTVIAKLSNADYGAQIKVLDAKIDEQKAVVADLKSRPKPQEVKLAQQVLEVARTREAFSREKTPRIEKLYRAGVATFEEFDTARKDHSTDLMQVAEKQAALDLAKVGATVDQVVAAEAKIDSLKEERKIYVDKVARTTLRMPFDGNILTLHLKDRINSYLDKGQPFASVENAGSVTAEIEIVESDLQYVHLGASVRVRPAAFFSREFEGKVTLIDRNVTSKSFGNVVKVIATIDNGGGLLKTGMTGQAKIDGVTLPVWQAFSQAIARFVRVQIWSWIP